MAEFKFFCPQCGRGIQCDASYSRTQINCPVCQQPITVPQAVREAASTLPPPVMVKSKALQNTLVITASVLALAGLVIGGWFGYSKIKMHGVRQLPAGAVTLWSGEGNGKDSVAANDFGLVKNVTFENGQIGRAFSMNGESSYLKASASTSLNVGSGNGFTIIAWINPTATTTRQPLVEWNNGNGSAVSFGVHLWLSVDHEGNVKIGSLQGNIVDSDGQSHGFSSAADVIRAGRFQHIALTYDHNSGLGKIYRDGVLVAQQNLGFFTPQTTYDLYLGRRPATSGIAWNYSGKMDEVGIFNRALADSEIQAIYAAQK